MKWQTRPKAPSAFFKKFPEYSPLIVQLFYNRRLKTQQQIDEFFNPDYEKDIHDPFLLKGMKKAVKRILKAIEKQENILIYGDFDDHHKNMWHISTDLSEIRQKISEDFQVMEHRCYKRLD